MKIIDQFQEKTREELCKLLPLQRKKKERKEKENNIKDTDLQRIMADQSTQTNKASRPCNKHLQLLKRNGIIKYHRAVH